MRRIIQNPPLFRSFLFFRRIYFLYDGFKRIENGRKGKNRLGFSARRNGGTVAHFRHVPREGNRTIKTYVFFKDVSCFHVGRQSGIAQKNGGKNFYGRVKMQCPKGER